MNQPARAVVSDLTDADDAGLAEKVAELVDRLQRGERVDLTDMEGRHAEELRRLLPTIRMMGDLAGPSARATDLGSLGDFRILREAGRGGMGIIYEAEQVSLGRRVALKVLLNAASLEPRHLQRFQVEAQAAASLHHPSIVPVFAIGAERGIPFYAMQLIEGQNLARLVEGWGKASVSASSLTRERSRTVATLGRQAAQALAFAHAHEVVHRDIKPSNLLVDEAGHLWITDFGLARIQGELDLTRTGDNLGTPRYMSPEQALGSRAPLDGRTDIYSLGATLYELLALRPAFDAEDRIKLLRQIAEQEPRPPRQIDPSIPVDLETIVLKAMAKAPAERYATAQDLAEDLGRFLDDRPIRAKRPTVPERAAKWAKRNRTIVAAGTIAALVILVALTCVGGWSIIWLRRHNAALRQQGVALQHAVERADANALLARRHLLAFELRQAQQHLGAGQIERSQDILDGIGPGPDGNDPRGFAWHYLSRLARREIIQLRLDNRHGNFVLSPDGRGIVISDPEGRIDLWDLVSLRRKADFTGTATHAYNPSFSPDGRFLVAVVDEHGPRAQSVVVWDAVTGQTLTRLLPREDVRIIHSAEFVRGHTLGIYIEDDNHRFVLWNLEPDPVRPRKVGTFLAGSFTVWAEGGRLITREGGRGDRLRIIDDDTGAARVELAGTHGSLNVDALWATSEDGCVIAGAFAGRRVILWDAATGAELERFHLESGPCQRLIFAPDGRHLAARDDTTGQIHVWDRSARRLLTLHVDEPGRSSRTMAMAFSRDSRCLAVTASGTPGGSLPVALWDIATGQRVKVCPGIPAGLGAFTPDGRYMVLNGPQTIRLWRLDPEPPITLAGHKDEAWAVAFSGKGDLLASGCDDEGGEEPNTIKLWDPETGRLVRGWFGGDGTVSSLAFAPDGKILASAHLDETGSIRLWDVASGKLLATLKGHTKMARSVAFNPSGRLLASSASDGTARIWDVALRRCIRVLERHQNVVQEVVFSPDGTTLATAGVDQTIRLWEVATGQQTRVLEGGAFMSVAFSPDGAILAAADHVGQAWLWNAQSGTPLGTLPCSQEELNAVAFTRGGEALAVAGTSGRIELWDVVTHQALLTLQAEGPQINGLAFSPDGSTLASASHDGAVRLWSGGPESVPRPAP